MNINDAFPSKYIRATDCEDDDGNPVDLILTIEAVELEDVGQGSEKQEKPVAYFTEMEKGLVLNRTNAETIVGIYGSDTDAWVGRKIALFQTEVSFQGKQTMAVRVRMKAPGGRRPTPTAPPAPDPRTQRNLSSAAAQGAPRAQPAAAAAGRRAAPPAPVDEGDAGLADETDPFGEA